VGSQEVPALARITHHRAKIAYLCRFFILFNGDVRLSSTARDFHGSNFLLEPPRFLRGDGLLIGSDAVVVLLLTVEPMVIRTLLALEAHVLVLERVSQAVLEHAVYQRLVAELGASSHVGQIVWGVAHALASCSDDDIGIASYDCLRPKDDGLEGGRADFVDGCSDDIFGEACAEHDLTGGVLAETGAELDAKAVLCCRDLLCRKHIAQEHLLNIVWFDARALHSSFNDLGAQLRGAEAGERATPFFSLCIALGEKLWNVTLGSSPWAYGPPRRYTQVAGP
jgi:hypothetical protein